MYCTLMRTKECFDALMLSMSVGDQDMHGCTTNENRREETGIKEILKCYMRLLSMPPRTCLTGDVCSFTASTRLP